MSGIFISYRRQDSAGHTGRLLDWLVARFGQELVFRDLESIEPGEDFVKAVQSAIAKCDVLLAVIGQAWVSCTDRQGLRRLQNSTDLVRSEIRAALAQRLPLIPVLIQGATMPLCSDLPEDLQGVTDINAIELSDRRWQYDCAVLDDQLSKILHYSGDNQRQASSEVRDIRSPNYRRTEDNSFLEVNRNLSNTSIRIGRGLKIVGSTIGTIAGSIVRANGIVHVPAREVTILECASITNSSVSEMLGFKIVS